MVVGVVVVCCVLATVANLEQIVSVLTIIGKRAYDWANRCLVWLVVVSGVSPPISVLQFGDISLALAGLGFPVVRLTAPTVGKRHTYARLEEDGGNLPPLRQRGQNDKEDFRTGGGDDSPPPSR